MALSILCKIYLTKKQHEFCLDCYFSSFFKIILVKILSTKILIHNYVQQKYKNQHMIFIYVIFILDFLLNSIV